MICKLHFRVKLDCSPYFDCFCRVPKLIENYDLAISDTTQTWVCHHRLETHFSDGTPRPKNAQLSREELIALGMYYNRPSEELIFLTEKEHQNAHHKGKSVQWKQERKYQNPIKVNLPGIKANLVPGTLTVIKECTGTIMVLYKCNPLNALTVL